MEICDLTDPMNPHFSDLCPSLYTSSNALDFMGSASKKLKEGEFFLLLPFPNCLPSKSYAENQGTCVDKMYHSTLVIKMNLIKL